MTLPIDGVNAKQTLSDDQLLVVSSVTHIKGNVWKVVILDSSGSSFQSVSCCLSAVELVASCNLLDVIHRLERIMNEGSRRVLLRVDFCEYSNVETRRILSVLQGDLIFVPNGETEWVSLQEELLQANVGYLCRPSPFRWESMMTLDKACPDPCGHEAFLKKADCVVMDVLRGDMFVVRWISPSDSLPPIFVLRMTPCEVASVELMGFTSKGFHALRWSRRYIGKIFSVSIHSLCPSEKSLACNSYAVSLDHRGAVEGIASYIDEKGVEIDVSVEMLHHRLVALREVPYPYHKLFFHISTAVVKYVTETPTCDNEEDYFSEMSNNLSSRLRLSRTQSSRLLTFLGKSWLHSSSQSVLGESLTRVMMKQYIWCGDYKEERSTKVAYEYRPLRLLFPMFKIAAFALPFQGYVKKVLLHSSAPNDAGEKGTYLQLDVEVWSSEETWLSASRAAAAEPSGLIKWNPISDAGVYLKHVAPSIIYTGTEQVNLSVGVRRCLTSEYASLPSELTDMKEVLQPDNSTALRYDFPRQESGEHEEVVVFEVLVTPKRADVTMPPIRSRAIYRLWSLNMIEDEVDEVDNYNDAQVSMDAADLRNQDEEPLETECSALTEGLAFISTVPFFYKVNPSLHDDLNGLAEQVRRWQQQVICLPISLAYVNGSLGFIGNIVFASDHTADKSFEMTALDPDATIGLIKSFRADAVDIFDAVEATCGPACWEGCAASEMYRARDESKTVWRQLRESDSLDHFLKAYPSSRKPSVRMLAGAPTVLWRDSRAPSTVVPHISPEIFPESIKLISMSMISRHLVVENHKKAMKCWKEGTSPYCMPDFPFWAHVNVPTLPVVFKDHLDALPDALLNVERAYCDHLIRQSPESEPTARKTSNERKEREWKASGESFASLMALLFHVRSLSVYKSNAAPQVLEENPQLMVANRLCNPLNFSPQFTSSMVLYVLPSEQDSNREIVYLGSRSSMKNCFRDLPSPYSSAVDCTYVSRSWMRRMAPLLAYESYVALPGESTNERLSVGDVPTRLPKMESNDGETHLLSSAGDRQLSGVGEASYRRRTNSLPFIYHPLPWLDILGQPLMRRRENEKDHHFLLSYRIPLCHPQLYKPFPHGQLTKKAIRSYQEKSWRRLHYVRDWCKVLLCRSAPPAYSAPSSAARGTDSISCDGVLYVFGTPVEAINVHYMTQRQLRVDECLPLREEAAPNEDSQLQHDLKSLAEPVREVLSLILEHMKATPSSRFSLTAESQWPIDGLPYMNIRVRQVAFVDSISDADRQEEWEAYSRAALGHQQNPYRPLPPLESMEDLVEEVLCVSYDAQQDEFLFSWKYDAAPEANS